MNLISKEKKDCIADLSKLLGGQNNKFTKLGTDKIGGTVGTKEKIKEL